MGPKVMAKIRHPVSTKGLGCFFILFALPFSAVGVWMAVWLVGDIASYLRMQGWVETPAKIVRAELKVDNDGDSTTFKAKAEYEYQFDGRDYHGGLVSIFGGDNIGPFQQDVHRRLSEHQKSGRPFRCFVNPANPVEAVLYRDLRWEMIGFKAIFIIGFGFVGFGLTTLIFVAYRKLRDERVRAAVHPDEPWLWKADWAEGRIVSSTQVRMIVVCVIALLWNLFSVPVWLSAPVPEIENPLSLFFLGAFVVGGALILVAIASMARWRKYGRSVFQMASVPGVVGGPLAGVIHVPAKVQSPDGFRLTLNCLKETGDGTIVEWQDEEIITRQIQQVDPERSAIPVLFHIPYECAETSDSQTAWRLDVRGGDYRVSFVVPVFKTAASDPDFVLDQNAIADFALSEDLDRDLRAAGVLKTLSATGAGYRFVFPMCRNLRASLFLSIFCILWSGAFALLFVQNVMVFFLIVFGLFEVIILLITVDFWFYRSVVDASPLGIAVAGGWFGWGRVRMVEMDNIKNIQAAANEYAGAYVFYHIVLVRREGKKITLGKRILGKRLAKVVVRQIEQAMGQEPVATETNCESNG